ncbi:MAG: trypsin-like peptidase domain-containing protein [Proteobacteria bacterium]|nr:trypsin-like peptidase domain-containing protein [Pseudomonadota bacterium]
MNLFEHKCNKLLSGLLPGLCLALFVALLFPARLFAVGADEAENIRVFELASPSVVNIVNSTVRYDSFYRAIAMEDVGAGVVLDRGGRILTSLHLIEGAQKIEATFFDGTVLGARIVGVDRDTDIAVLKVVPPGNGRTKDGHELLAPLRFAETELKVGAKVLAIGNPFGLEKSLSVGIVSSKSRRMRAVSGSVMEGLIQTDAATNPGSSGGPLLNSNAEMVGLNAAIFSPVPGSVGVGLAIPVATITKSLASLDAFVPRVWVGITGQDMDSLLAERMEFKEPGILVASVFEQSPAGIAGVKGATGIVNLKIKKGQLRIAVGGDYITEIDGHRVEKMEDFNGHVAGKRPGAVVTVVLLRAGKPMVVEVTLEPRPRLK